MDPKLETGVPQNEEKEANATASLLPLTGDLNYDMDMITEEFKKKAVLSKISLNEAEKTVMDTKLEDELPENEEELANITSPLLRLTGNVNHDFNMLLDDYKTIKFKISRNISSIRQMIHQPREKDKDKRQKLFYTVHETTVSAKCSAEFIRVMKGKLDFCHPVLKEEYAAKLECLCSELTDNLQRLHVLQRIIVQQEDEISIKNVHSTTTPDDSSVVWVKKDVIMTINKDGEVQPFTMLLAQDRYVYQLEMDIICVSEMLKGMQKQEVAAPSKPPIEVCALEQVDEIPCNR